MYSSAPGLTYPRQVLTEPNPNTNVYVRMVVGLA